MGELQTQLRMMMSLCGERSCQFLCGQSWLPLSGVWWLTCGHVPCHYYALGVGARRLRKREGRGRGAAFISAVTAETPTLTIGQM